MPADAVKVIATHLRSDVSSALRRIAVEQLSVERQYGAQVYAEAHEAKAIPVSAGSHDNSRSGDEIAGALISFVIWAIFIGIAIFVALSRKKGT